MSRNHFPVSALRLSLLALMSLSAAALSGCGFHLQGASPLPEGIDTMYVRYSDKYRVAKPTLVESLQQRLREQGLLGAADASAQLDIQDIDNRQRIVSVSPLDGRVAEFQLTTRVVFSYIVNGAVQLEDETLSVTRDFSFADTERLAAESEKRDLQDSMHEELANLVLLRIADANDTLVAKKADAS